MCYGRDKKTEYKTFIFNCHTVGDSPAPNDSSIWIELVAAVKVFEIEERREIAAGHVRPMPFLSFCHGHRSYIHYNQSDL